MPYFNAVKSADEYNQRADALKQEKKTREEQNALKGIISPGVAKPGSEYALQLKLLQQQHEYIDATRKEASSTKFDEAFKASMREGDINNLNVAVNGNKELEQLIVKGLGITGLSNININDANHVSLLNAKGISFDDTDKARQLSIASHFYAYTDKEGQQQVESYSDLANSFGTYRRSAGKVKKALENSAQEIAYYINGKDRNLEQQKLQTNEKRVDVLENIAQIKNRQTDINQQRADDTVYSKAEEIKLGYAKLRVQELVGNTTTKIKDTAEADSVIKYLREQTGGGLGDSIIKEDSHNHLALVKLRNFLGTELSPGQAARLAKASKLVKLASTAGKISESNVGLFTNFLSGVSSYIPTGKTGADALKFQQKTAYNLYRNIATNLVAGGALTLNEEAREVDSLGSLYKRYIPILSGLATALTGQRASILASVRGIAGGIALVNDEVNQIDNTLGFINDSIAYKTGAITAEEFKANDKARKQERESKIQAGYGKPQPQQQKQQKGKSNLNAEELQKLLDILNN